MLAVCKAFLWLFEQRDHWPARGLARQSMEQRYSLDAEALAYRTLFEALKREKR
jgi:hypothetical protein